MLLPGCSSVPYRWCFLIISLVVLCNAQNYSIPAPLAVVKNGTYQGQYLPGWDQDAFLGLPYAQPPVGQLRFRWPQSLNSSFTGVKSAEQYGYSCYQYGTTFNLSEDCLTLNVVRPHGTLSNSSLPVLVWIYGGGLYTGSTADPQYNLSGIVSTSQSISQPVIAVSMNYRLAVWGFLQTPQILAEGSSNAGLLDQRMAFRWVKENIAAFGGDPDRITIWGESAGAQSIGYHLNSYGGRNDNLFQNAIMESGGPEGTAVESLSFYASPVENLTRTTGCYTASDQLACLRSLSSAALFAAHVSQTWNPIIDGDFLTGYPSQLQQNNSYIKVPLLIGANTDEGLSFGTKGINNDTALFDSLLTYRSYALSPPTIRTLLALYPPTPPAGTTYPPYDFPNTTFSSSYGSEYPRYAAIAGDVVIIGDRRKMCRLYSADNLPVYSYRFDTQTWNATHAAGIPHFVNVVFSFQNISGALGPLPQFQSYKDLATAIGTAYANFAYYSDPNGNGDGGSNQTTTMMERRDNSSMQLPYWPRYDVAKPMNMVLNATGGSFVEDDTFREQQIAFINEYGTARELLG